MTDPNLTLPEGTILPRETSIILNSPMLVMGLTTSGKSSLLATAAEYVWETYGLMSLLYSCDGGGFPVQMQSLINLGIVRAWRMRTRSGQGLIHENCQRAAQGWWPKTINPRTGEVSPNVDLIPPLTTRIQVICPQGHVVTTVTHDVQLNAAMTCPTCKTAVNKGNMKTARTSARTKGFERVGACLYDGISSMMSWGMDDLTERTGRMELTGEKSALGGIITSGGLTLAGSNRAQVGFMQKRAESLIAASNAIPGLVIPPIWTALVQSGTEEGGLPIWGPQIIGQARTAEAPQWFGDSVESVIVTTADGKRFRRLYLQQYIDGANVRHLCGVRSFPTFMPAYLEDEELAEGYVPFENFSLGRFFRLRDEARQKTEAGYKAKYPDAPGVAEGEVTIGDDLITPATPSPITGPGAGPRPGPPGLSPAAARAAASTSPARAGALSPSAPTTAPGPSPAAAPAPAPPVGPVTARAVTSGAPPPGPKPPARGPSAPPPGRRPVAATAPSGPRPPGPPPPVTPSTTTT